MKTRSFELEWPSAVTRGTVTLSAKLDGQRFEVRARIVEGRATIKLSGFSASDEEVAALLEGWQMASAAPARELEQ